MSAIGILATGSYVPKQIVTGDDVAGPAGVTSEWIERKTQIFTRRYAAPDQATSDLATEAANRTLEQAGVPASALRYLIVSTSTPDSPQPPTSYLVQNAIGADRAACFDINVVCSGFVYGLALARALVAQEPGAYALVVAADVYSRILDVTDRKTVVLLGDGAGAALVGGVTTGGFLDVELSSHGHAQRLIRVCLLYTSTSSGWTAAGCATSSWRTSPARSARSSNAPVTRSATSTTSFRTRPTVCCSANWSPGPGWTTPGPIARWSATATPAARRSPSPWTPATATAT